MGASKKMRTTLGGLLIVEKTTGSDPITKECGRGNPPCLHRRAATRAPTPHPLHSRPYASERLPTQFHEKSTHEREPRFWDRYCLVQILPHDTPCHSQ